MGTGRRQGAACCLRPRGGTRCCGAGNQTNPRRAPSERNPGARRWRQSIEHVWGARLARRLAQHAAEAEEEYGTEQEKKQEKGRRTEHERKSRTGDGRINDIASPSSRWRTRRRRRTRSPSTRGRRRRRSRRTRPLLPRILF